jgi:PKD repeat protein
VFAVAHDGTPDAKLATTAPKDQTATPGKALSADLGSVTGGVPGSTGYEARVQWGDGTVPDDATVDSSGAISGQHTYVQEGTYTVHVTTWDTLSSSTETFTVTVGKASLQPSISASASGTLSAGDSITINGSGFAAGEQVTVKLGTSPARTLTVAATSEGAVHASIAASGDAQPGRYAITAAGKSSRTPATATVQVTEGPAVPAYQPQVLLSTTSGPRGTAIIVNGSGFEPNEAVTIRFGNGLASITVHANGDGVISAATISVPGTAKPGSTSITLAGADSATHVRLPFTVSRH